MGRTFEQNMQTLEKLLDIAKMNQQDSQTLQYISKIEQKLDAIHCKLLLPFKHFSSTDQLRSQIASRKKRNGGSLSVSTLRQANTGFPFQKLLQASN
jgi:hypothetical protein